MKINTTKRLNNGELEILDQISNMFDLNNLIYDIIIIPFDTPRIYADEFDITWNVFITCKSMKNNLIQVIQQLEEKKEVNVVFKVLDVDQRLQMQEEWIENMSVITYDNKYGKFIEDG